MTTNGNGTAIQGYFFEDLAVGMEASFSKKISNDDVLTFAGLSGDINPVHLDDAYAAGTMFKQRIAHGILTASLLSTVLGTKLPGPGWKRLSKTTWLISKVRCPGDGSLNLGEGRARLDGKLSLTAGRPWFPDYRIRHA